MLFWRPSVRRLMSTEMPTTAGGSGCAVRRAVVGLAERRDRSAVWGPAGRRDRSCRQGSWSAMPLTDEHGADDEQAADARQAPLDAFAGPLRTGRRRERRLRVAGQGRGDTTAGMPAHLDDAAASLALPLALALALAFPHRALSERKGSSCGSWVACRDVFVGATGDRAGAPGIVSRASDAVQVQCRQWGGVGDQARSGARPRDRGISEYNWGPGSRGREPRT